MQPDEMRPDEPLPSEVRPSETGPSETGPSETGPPEGASPRVNPPDPDTTLPQVGRPESNGPADGDATEVVRVRVALTGIELSFEGRRSFFEEHVEPLLDAAYTRAEGGLVEPAAAPSQGAMFRPSSPQRFQKFAVQVGANAVTVDQRVMVFAFYLWNYERKDEFGLDDIAAFFRTVKEEPPEDLAPLLEALATSKRFLELRDGTQAMCLTTKGVNYVKNRLLGPA